MTDPVPPPPAPKPGPSSSEFWLTAAKQAVAAAVAFCTITGLGVPAWLRPDAPWVAGAALLASALVTIAYVLSRTALKRPATTPSSTELAELAAYVDELHTQLAELATAVHPPLGPTGSLGPSGPTGPVTLVHPHPHRRVP